MSIHIEKDMRDITLTSITSDRNTEMQSNFDADFSAAALVNQQLLDYQFDTFTQEFRLSSTSESGIQWTAGIFYSDEDTINNRTVLFGPEMNLYADLILGAGTPGTLDVVAANYGAFPGVNSSADFFVENGGSTQELFNMSSKTVSLFANADIPLADDLTVTIGLNKTNDKKTVTSDVDIVDVFSTLPLAGTPFEPAEIAQFFPPFTDYPNANEDGIFKSDDLTHTLRLTYDLNQSTKVYASHSTGFKPISVNLSVNAVDSTMRNADEEYSENIEIGLKHTMDNGYLNIALFDQNIEGFQSNTFNGQAFELTNAGNQKHRGLELDTKQQLSEDWLVGLSAMYIDAEYQEYDRGPCDHVTTTVDHDQNPSTDEISVVVFPSVACDLDNTGASLGYKNRAGETPAGIHEWSANLNSTYSFNLFDQWSSFLRLEYVYESEAAVVENVPAVPAALVGGTNIPAVRSSKNFNMSLGFTHNPSGVEVMLWGRNLTDHQSLLSAFPTTAAPGSYGGYPNAPKTLGITTRASF